MYGRFGASLLLLLASACGDGEETSLTTAEPDGLVVRVNTVGFLPERGKRATYVGRQSSFEVRRVEDDSVVHSGEAGPDVDAQDSGEVVHVVDFREVTEPGEYYLQVRGVGRSPSFRIGEGTPIATAWVDETEDFRSNEVAINWNAALVYALAAYLP